MSKGAEVEIFTHRHEYHETREELIIPKANRYRVWAAKNAYALGTLAVFFLVTWVLMFVIVAIYGGPHHG